MEKSAVSRILLAVWPLARPSPGLFGDKIWFCLCFPQALSVCATRSLLSIHQQPEAAPWGRDQSGLAQSRLVNWGPLFSEGMEMKGALKVLATPHSYPTHGLPWVLHLTWRPSLRTCPCWVSTQDQSQNQEWEPSALPCRRFCPPPDSGENSKCSV